MPDRIPDQTPTDPLTFYAYVAGYLKTVMAAVEGDLVGLAGLLSGQEAGLAEDILQTLTRHKMAVDVMYRRYADANQERPSPERVLAIRAKVDPNPRGMPQSANQPSDTEGAHDGDQ